MILAPFVTFAANILRKGPAVLLTEGMQNLRLDGFLTLVATTYGRLGELITLTRYPKQMRENVKKFDMKRATNSIPVQLNCFHRGENKTFGREEDVRH